MNTTNRTLTALLSTAAMAIALAAPVAASAAPTAAAAKAQVPATQTPAAKTAPKKGALTALERAKARRKVLPREWRWTKQAKRFDHMFRK